MIPKSQLATWANVGAIKAATDTYASIKAAIDAAKATTLKAYSYNVYLQGSYRNSTNIYGDMDVDVVVEAADFFYRDIDGLTDAQKEEYKRRFSGTTDNSFSDFRSAVEKALTEYFDPALITLRNKCILIEGDSGRLDADVVPSVEYRDYRKNEAVKLPEPEVGITFWTRSNARQVINYPKQHYDNGATKNKRTSERFKPTVRIFKNLRNHCVVNDLVRAEVAPSYFVSCLIYNAPNDAFKRDHDDTVLAILNWMHSLTDEHWDNLLCQNELYYLCRNVADLWPRMNAQKFRNAAICAWNDWGK